ncbi:type VI secretion system lipoprotein TssJ [Pseudomonas sp. D47]|uniref:type VI secretion system lipoprotein TssJ n=1 Tax=Pseudomonas sp. D47 TaxID=3159447 RepID=UPI00387ADC1E
MPHFKLLAALICAWLLSACSALSPHSQVTKLDLQLFASKQLNPDINGRPSPLVLRLIELKHPVSFETTDFFGLYERPNETLSPDLISSEEVRLLPGTHHQMNLRLKSDSRYVGVLAAYRNLPETQWRYLIQLTPAGITQTHLLLDDSGIHNSNAPVAISKETP